MTLTERVVADLTAAMKAKDARRVSVLRMLKTALDNATIALRAKGESLDDERAGAQLQTEAKRLRESIQEFRAGGREDLATATSAELTVIEAYLPQQLADADVRAVVEAKRAATGASSVGALMGPVMQELRGRADGAIVRRIVEEVLKQ